MGRAKENQEMQGKEVSVVIKRTKKDDKCIRQGLEHEAISALMPWSTN